MRSEKYLQIGITSAVLLLLIICLTHLLVLLGFSLGVRITALVFPTAALIGLGTSYWFSSKSIAMKEWWIAVALTAVCLVVAMLLSWFYFDLSWDGQWYQQSAVYDLGGSWNPIYQPLQTPDHSNQPSVLHFPKATWYFGAALMKLFGSIEIGKAYNWLTIFIAFPVIFSFSNELRLSAFRSCVITVLLVFNPVVLSEVTTCLNDGDLYLFWITYLVATMGWLRDGKKVWLSIAVMSAICLVNLKFTGLVFFIASSFFFLVYVLISKRKITKSFISAQIVAGLLAVVVFGFNPYVTNTVHRHHPLYPLMGTKAYPSVFAASGSDDNENYETPVNMRGKSLPVRLLYANFGAPGNAPYNGEDSAKLALPFTSGFKNLRSYEYHETRVSGFGPLFGIALLLSIPALLIAFLRMPSLRIPVTVFLVGLVCCLSFSKHFWWPRFFPIFWVIPIFSLLLVWLSASLQQTQRSQKMGTKLYAWLLAICMACNMLIVGYVHLKWETLSSIHLRSELTELSYSPHPITVDYGWFRRAIEERFKYWNIPFKAGPVPADSSARKLTSVVEGYPNQVMYRYR